MSADWIIPSLALFTILAVLGLAIWQFSRFLSKRRNREIASHALGLDEGNSGSDRR